MVRRTRSPMPASTASSARTGSLRSVLSRFYRLNDKGSCILRGGDFLRGDDIPDDAADQHARRSVGRNRRSEK